MNVSDVGLLLTKKFEGCKLASYLDQVGVPTIGYGHTHGVHLGQVCTQQQADLWLKEDMQSAAAQVTKDVHAPLTQGQFDALADFVFNLGDGAIEHSTLLRLLNNGDYRGAANEFEKWDHAGGKVVAGLLRRRQVEKAEFTQGEENDG